MRIEPGMKFGRMTVERHERVNRRDYCDCVCECGNRKRVRFDHLYSGGTTSCGCFHSKQNSERMWKAHAANVTHGASGTRAHSIWFGVRQRCTNPQSRFFAYYGGRGISICERWNDFANFLADMGQPGSGMTLDRRDANGNYEPANCRWATRKEQMNNRRCNVVIEWRGESLTRAQWSERTGIHRNTIAQRQARGVAPDELFVPAKPKAMRKLQVG